MRRRSAPRWTSVLPDDRRCPRLRADRQGVRRTRHRQPLDREYVRGGVWHTNTVEGYFSILKRGIIGTYHHVSQQHLKRYLAEFDYRYNEREGLKVSDFERFQKSLPGIVGRRLTYRRTRGEQENRNQA